MAYRYIRIYVDTGFAGATHEEIYRVAGDDEFPRDDELMGAAEEFAMNTIEYGGHEITAEEARGKVTAGLDLEDVQAW